MNAQHAWAAGLFEGEGCLSSKRSKRGRVSPCFSMNQTDEDVLRRFAAVVGVGNVHGPYDKGPRKPMWSWTAQGWPIYDHLVDMLLPWLGLRRSARFAELAAQRPGPVINGIANLEKTHCPQGHPYDEENTIVNIRGERICRICANDQARASYWRRAEAACL